MRRRVLPQSLVLSFVLSSLFVVSADESPAKLAQKGDKKEFVGPHGLKVRVHVMTPQKQPCDILYLGFIKHRETGDRVTLTIKNFDDNLGGLIAALRNRGEFDGKALETILIQPPKGALDAEKLMLIGWGDDDQLSMQTLRGVGTTTVREATRLGAKSMAFGAALRDQENTTFGTGQVAREVVRSAVLAYDTQKHLEKDKLGGEVALTEFIYLAGPEYYHEVHPLVKKGLDEAMEHHQVAIDQAVFDEDSLISP